MADEKKQTRAEKYIECLEKRKAKGMNIDDAIKVCKEAYGKTTQDKAMDVLYGALVIYVIYALVRMMI